MPQPPFAQLQAVDLSHLLEHDAEEITKLAKACQEDGFFYLNLTDKRFEGILKDWKTLLPLVNNWFNEPIEDKMKYNHGTVRHG
jgi:isopenicillin N synthase-like dioxygenase